MKHAYHLIKVFISGKKISVTCNLSEKNAIKYTVPYLLSRLTIICSKDYKNICQ